MQSWLQNLWFDLFQPWSLYQFGIVVGCYIISRLAVKMVEPWFEQKVRGIKGKPGLLRVMVAFLRNTDWLLFSFLLSIVYLVMQQITWPSHSYFIGIAVQLSITWVVIAVLSKIIRNRFLARTTAMVCWGFVALSLLDLVEPTIEVIDSVAYTFGSVRISLLMLFEGIVLVIGMLWGANTLGKFFERQINNISDLNPSLKVLTGKIIKIFLYIFALGIALSSIGFDLTALTIFSGAVGVGIGLGLQKVFSNYLSGIIILMDKSIKPGDTISVGQTFGWIRELRARFVSVITRDGKEFLIPNEDLITLQVVNWSFSDKLVRLDVPFGVSYKSNPYEVSKLVIEAARTVDRVSTIRAPVCWMTEFGESSLNFLLRFWIEDPQNGLTNIRGKVLLAVWDTFAEHKIDVPYPHRELILRNPEKQSLVIEPEEDQQSSKSQ